MPEPVSFAIFSDVICPWCFLGKRRLERALDQIGMRKTALIRWLPFELNPDMPPEGMERSAYRERKFGPERAAALDREMTALGQEEGVRFAFDRMERTPNTRAAHCLIAHASQNGRGAAAVEALFAAYFERALDIGRIQILADIGEAIGLERAGVLAALSDEGLSVSVVELEREAGRLGIAGVPFFIIDDAWSVSGAQPAGTWVDIMQEMHAVPAEGQVQ